jgi:hypothetical protein
MWKWENLAPLSHLTPPNAGSTVCSKGPEEVTGMLDLSKRHNPDIEEKRVIFLEFVAASAIFLIVAVVLYMVFTYKPA